MIELRKMSEPDTADVLRLSVATDQSSFVAPIADILANLQSAVPNLILADKQLVGFFLLDPDYSQQYDFCPSDGLGFRSFFIDQQHQGKGFASAAVRSLSEYVEKSLPNTKSIWLTVNCKNPLAYACYLKYGFVDTGELYLGGSAGPQHIMVLSLDH